MLKHIEFCSSRCCSDSALVRYALPATKCSDQVDNISARIPRHLSGVRANRNGDRNVLCR